MRYALLVVCWLAQQARADVEVNLAVKAAKDAAHAPEIEATIIGAPKLPADKISIALSTAPTATLRATKVRSYAEGTEPIAVVFVIEGQEVWIGNDDVEKDAAAKQPGALKTLAKALDGWKLAAPAGSTGAIVTYNDAASIRVPLGALKTAITGKSLGAQKDYYRKIGNDLVGGLDQGLALLTKSPAARKALVVIGDGNDTNPAVAKPRLAEMKKQAAQAGIKVFAIVYKSAVSEPETLVTTLTSHADTIPSIAGMAPALGKIRDALDDRYYVTFPGYDPKTHVGLAWDGKPHDLVITLDKTTEKTTLSMAPQWTPPATK